MDTHLVKADLCIGLIFCQSCDVTVDGTNCLPYLHKREKHYNCHEQNGKNDRVPSRIYI